MLGGVRDSKFAMVTVQTIVYQCVKFLNFPTSGSMGCHRLQSGIRRRMPIGTIGICIDLVNLYKYGVLTIYCPTKAKDLNSLECETEKNYFTFFYLSRQINYR